MTRVHLEADLVLRRRLSWSVATGSPERRVAIRSAVRRYQREIIDLVRARGGAS